MAKSLYLINPPSDFPNYFGTEVYGAVGLPPKAYVLDQSTTTLAGMAPHDFHVELCEANVSRINYKTDCELVGITGKISQWQNMKKIAIKFKKLGKTVIIGGPHASLSPDTVRPYCDILVRGEIEDIYPALFADLRNSKWKREYIGTKPDLSNAVMPNYSIYPNNDTQYGTIQISRGCPFQCEFCDVIQYLGNKQRHKPIELILKELDELYKLGYTGIFLTDDNFSAKMSKAKEILEALIQWNNNQKYGKVTFYTQISVNATKDQEFLELCQKAGIINAFIGLETVNEDSLKESNKKQNLGINFKEQIDILLEYGIQIFGGIIVGFDSDGPDIFEQIYNFASSLPVPILSVGSLVAPVATNLYTRIESENRLLQNKITEVIAVPWKTNIIPKKLTQEQLFSGMKWLCNNLYHPVAYEKRVMNFLRKYNFTMFSKQDTNSLTNPFTKNREHLFSHGKKLINILSLKGEQEERMVKRLTDFSYHDPVKSLYVYCFLVNYAQIRYMYEHEKFYDSSLISKYT